MVENLYRLPEKPKMFQRLLNPMVQRDKAP